MWRSTCFLSRTLGNAIPGRLLAVAVPLEEPEFTSVERKALVSLRCLTVYPIHVPQQNFTFFSPRSDE
jgi:hypothetical protein